MKKTNFLFLFLILFITACNKNEEIDLSVKNEATTQFRTTQSIENLASTPLEELLQAPSDSPTFIGSILVNGPEEFLPVIQSGVPRPPSQRPSPKEDTEGSSRSTCLLPIKMLENNTTCGFPITLDIIFRSLTNQSTTSITFQNTSDYVNLSIPEGHEVFIDVSTLECTGSFRLCKREGNLWNFIREFWGLCYGEMVILNGAYRITFPRQWPKNPSPANTLYTTYLCDDWCSETLDYTMTKIDGQSETNTSFVQASLLPENGQKFGNSFFFMKRNSISVQNSNPVNTGSFTLEPLLEDFQYTIEIKDVSSNDPPNRADFEFTVNPTAEFAFLNNDFAPPMVTQNFLVQHNGLDCDASHTDCNNGVSVWLSERHCGVGSLYRFNVNISQPFSRIDWSSTGNINWHEETTDIGQNEAIVNGQKPITHPIQLKIFLDNGCVITKTIDLEFENSFDDCD